MDQSRRAVESYWRSRLVDGVTTDEDKVAPFYKIEEISELLRTSDAGIVKEVSDFILKKLDHKSPVVKQKALRLIKCSVGKSGTEFRREMQRHSAAVRQLVHYKGHPDPLKGDALNKAVRETANETIAAIFAAEEAKSVAPTEGLGKRIQGFGNTNYEPSREEKKSFISEVVGIGSASIKQGSFISEVVGIGSASIKQGLSNFAAAQSIMKNDNGTYKSPTLRRSLTTERENDRQGRYDPSEIQSEGWTSSSGALKNAASGIWGQDSRTSPASSATADHSSSSQSGVKTQEEKLLETIVTASGVRLQPTRDALQAFLAKASKLDAVAMSRALEHKLQSPLWQVRMKAICVLEAILRKKDSEPYSIIASYFSENRDSVVKCCDLPQVSLREKASKVLSMLDGDQPSGIRNVTDPSPSPAVQMPDLIDTLDLDDTSSEPSSHTEISGTINTSASPIDDLFASEPVASLSTTSVSDRSDLFAGVSFHEANSEEPNDLFSGMAVDDKTSAATFPDIFGDKSEQLFQETSSDKGNVSELLGGLTLNGNPQGQLGVNGESNGNLSGSQFFDRNSQPSQPGQMLGTGASNGLLGPNAFYPQVPLQYNMPPNIMLNQAYAGQPVAYGGQQLNYGAMGALLAQQQLMQNFGNLNSGIGNASFNAMDSGHGSTLPDIFNATTTAQSHVATMSTAKKEETKAFDFVSDHLAAARGSKKVM